MSKINEDEEWGSIVLKQEPDNSSDDDERLKETQPQKKTASNNTTVSKVGRNSKRLANMKMQLTMQLQLTGETAEQKVRKRKRLSKKEQIANETPEQRDKRLEGLRLYRQRRKARLNLIAWKASKDEDSSSSAVKPELDGQNKRTKPKRNTCRSTTSFEENCSKEVTSRKKKTIVKNSEYSKSAKQQKVDSEPTAQVEKQTKRKRRSRKEQIANETPEQRAKRLEGKRLYWKRLKERETPEEKEKRLARERESVRKRFAADGRGEIRREKQKFYYVMRRATITEEKKAEEKTNKYFYRQANKERWKYSNLSEEQKQRRKEMNSRWVKSLEGEKKQRYSECVAAALKKSRLKKLESLKKDSEKWKAYQEQQQKNRRSRLENST